ncbi:MAG: glutamate--tRNA ligase, partial [Burkholderiales bacterium]|nr:glutamate--tRNA ligase [Burkholderiales bacterium]
AAAVVALLTERVSTLEELADAAVYFYRPLEPSAELKAQHYTAEIRPAITDLRQRLAGIEWTRAKIGETLKAVVTEHKLKLPKLAMPLRVMVTGEAQTPSVDAVLELIGREEVLARMERQLQAFPQ